MLIAFRHQPVSVSESLVFAYCLCTNSLWWWRCENFTRHSKHTKRIYFIHWQNIQQTTLDSLPQKTTQTKPNSPVCVGCVLCVVQQDTVVVRSCIHVATTCNALSLLKTHNTDNNTSKKCHNFFLTSSSCVSVAAAVVVLSSNELLLLLHVYLQVESRSQISFVSSLMHA